NQHHWDYPTQHGQIILAQLLETLRGGIGRATAKAGDAADGSQDGGAEQSQFEQLATIHAGGVCSGVGHYYCCPWPGELVSESAICATTSAWRCRRADKAPVWH